MKTMIKKSFDSIKYFRRLKEKMAEQLAQMTLEEQKEYLRKIRSGEIKLSSS